MVALSRRRFSRIKLAMGGGVESEDVRSEEHSRFHADWVQGGEEILAHPAR